MRSLFTTTTLAVCLLTSGVVNANYVIDDFTVAQDHSRSTVGTTTITNEIVATGTVFSGERHMTWSGTVAALPGSSSIGIGSGVLDIANSATASSETTIKWFSAASAGGIDLTQGGVNDSIYFEYLSDNPLAPVSSQLTFTITIFDTLGQKSVMLVPVAATFPAWNPVTILYTAFAPVDFTKVTEIDLTIHAPLNRDTSIRFFDSRLTAPEPTSMVLAGFAGIGMAVGAIRRRRQAKQAA